MFHVTDEIMCTRNPESHDVYRSFSNGYNVELFVTFISYCMETIKSDEALLLNSRLILYNIVIHGQLTTALLDQHVRI